MSDHRHEPYDIYGTAATSGEVGRLESSVAGLREDLGDAGERARETDHDVTVLAGKVEELRAQVSGLIVRVQALEAGNG